MRLYLKIFELLNHQEKKSFIILLLMIIIMALLEMFGVASIIPFITILTNPDLIDSNIILIYLYSFANKIGFSGQKEFLFILGILVFLFLIISLLFKSITIYFQLNFALMREFSFSKRLIQGYLSQQYAWFLNKNSSDLGKSILSEVNEVINKSILPSMELLAQSAVSISLISLLIFLDPILAITVGFVLLSSYLLIFTFMKNILSNIGSERFVKNLERYTVVGEVFGAIKEVKFKGLEDFYTNRFAIPASKFAKSQAFASIIAQLPRYFLEGIAFGGIILLILFLMRNESDFGNILPILAVYTFAGYRLMPALQTIYSSLAQIRFSKPALDKLHNDLLSHHSIFLNKSSEFAPFLFNKKIQLYGIDYFYQNNKNPALKNISLQINSGDRVGIVGETGSGKTTLVDLILGLLLPSAGHIAVDDVIIDKTNLRSWQKNIGYVPQQIYLNDGNIRENIAFGIQKEKIDENKLTSASKIASIHDFINNELTYGYETKVGERGVRISGGQKQRIGIQ